MAAAVERTVLANAPDPDIDWRRVVRLIHVSRGLDALEEAVLVPERKIFYQFSARGHDLAQILLGLQLTRRDDAICGYYRSRPILLSLGVRSADALGSSLARAGGYSDGRDIGAVFNFPNPAGPSRAAHVRRRRRAVHAHGRLGAGAGLSRQRPAGGRLRRCHRGGARRRCVGGDQRILVGSDDGHDAAAADAVLHRRQWLRHFRAVGAADAGRRHRRQSGRASRAAHISGDGTDPAEAAALDRGRGGACARAARAGASAAHRAAPRRPFLPGHADLQAGTYRCSRMGARSAAASCASFLVPAEARRSGMEPDREDAARAVEAARMEPKRVLSPTSHGRRACLLRRRDAGGGRPVAGGYKPPPRRAKRPSRRASASTWSPPSAARWSTS